MNKTTLEDNEKKECGSFVTGFDIKKGKPIIKWVKLCDCTEPQGKKSRHMGII